MAISERYPTLPPEVHPPSVARVVPVCRNSHPHFLHVMMWRLQKVNTMTNQVSFSPQRNRELKA